MAARRCGSQDQIVFLNLFSFVYEIVICFPYDVSHVGGLSGDSDMAGRYIWCGGGFAAVCDFFVRRERKAIIIVHHHPSLAQALPTIVVFWGLEHSGVRKQGGWLPICGGWIRGIKNPSGTRY